MESVNIYWLYPFFMECVDNVGLLTLLDSDVFVFMRLNESVVKKKEFEDYKFILYIRNIDNVSPKDKQKKNT